MTYYEYDGTAAAETASPGNNFYGTNGVDTLTGTSAAESFWGGQGDLMIGGGGDDTYYIKSAADQVVEQAGGGIDKIVSYANVSLANYANVENLEVDGNNVYGAGNAGDNVIQAGSGTVQIYGGGGQDVLVAGSGQDTFIVQAGAGNDVIYGFKPSEDVVRLSAGFTSFQQLQGHMSQVGADVKIDFGPGEGMILRNTQVGQLTAANFELQIDPAKLGQMTFHDEFSGPLSIWNATFNPTGTWRPDYGYQGPNGVGSYTLTGNGEQQIYTSPYFRGAAGDHASPFSVANGDLTITAAPSTASDLFGYGYTSGMISTKESFAQTYGYFEMRAELPHGAGGWPAFWLVPADGSWPPELDVMETLTGDANNDYTTVHSAQTGTHVADGVASYIPNTSDGFHTYGVLWTKTDLVWYVDGVEVFHAPTPADMNKPMYMIANLALGGWSGSIDGSSMPENMVIDYIRSYALADGSTTVQGFDANQASGSYTTTTSPADTGGTVPPPVTTPTSPPPPPPPVDTGAGQTISSHGYGDTLIGGSGDDTLTSSQGGETMTGGAGADTFVFHTTPWTPTHITDFTPGVDKLDLSGLYTDGYAGADPVKDGYVRFIADGHGGAAVIVDPDGPATGHLWGDYVADLQGVDPSTLTSASVFGGAAGVSPPQPASPPPPISPPPTSTGEVLTSAGYGATLAGGAGDDVLTSFQGGETMTGGAGHDTFVFKAPPWTPTHITDFTPGVDRLDITGLYTDGYAGSDPVRDGYVRFISDGNGGTAVIVDPDGPAAGHPWGDYVADLEHVDPASLTSANVFGATAAAAIPAAVAAPLPPPTSGQILTAHLSGDTLTGGAGDDTINASRGGDILTGGAGHDHFVFANEPWAAATITDFQHGQDVLDLRGMFAATGYVGTDPVADHYLSFISDGNGGTKVLFDPDGTASGHPWPDYVIDLQHVDPSTMTSADWIIR